DLAKVDEDGFFYIVDRKKDMVVSGGLNIYPREIEEVLAAHPAIKESAVIGIPDEQWGEALRAYVVLRADKHVSTQELDAHCRQVLAGYKVPRDYRYIGTLPRNAGGKVLKRELA
ncbi:MAG: AMP-binding enzyme, partial [Steroidobacteraceae bacterium]